MIVCGNCGALISTVDSPVVAFCDKNCLRNWRRFGPVAAQHVAEADSAAESSPWTYRKCGEMILANEGARRRLRNALETMERSKDRLMNTPAVHNSAGIGDVLSFLDPQIEELHAYLGRDA